MTRVHICNYGVGNIYNVERAFRHIGVEVISCTSGDMLEGAKHIVLPGVGAFGDCIKRFRAEGFEAPVRAHVEAGQPLLGICVGMQMLATVGEEFGHHRGLDLIPGTVSIIPDTDMHGERLRRPHIGWSRLLDANGKETALNWDGTPLEPTPPGTRIYFVHSYAFNCDDPRNVLATCCYGGHLLTAAVRYGQLIGTQFHPEKSGETGLNMLRAFAYGSTYRGHSL